MSITYPPELLPSPDEGAEGIEVVCVDADGKQRVVFRTEANANIAHAARAGEPHEQE